MPYVYVNPPLSGGNSGTAEKLAVPRLISLEGDVQGATFFDGSQDIVIRTKVKTTGGGSITGDDLGFGLTIEDERVVVDTGALVAEGLTTTQEGMLTLDAVDVNLLYVPNDTELIVGGN